MMNAPEEEAAAPRPADESPEDELLTCADCGKPFLFSAGEKTFYEERGFAPPRRCKPCRQNRKGSLHTPGRRSPAFMPRGAEAGVSGKPRFKIICASCNVETSVPFKPDPTRPVYCRKCYQIQRREKRGAGSQPHQPPPAEPEAQPPQPPPGAPAGWEEPPADA